MYQGVYQGDETFSQILQILGAGAHDTSTTVTAADLAAVHKAVTTENGFIHVVKVALAAVATAGGCFSWANPETGSIIIHRVIVDVTTISTGAATLDIGTTATNATTLSDNMLDGLDVHSGTGCFDGSYTSLLDGGVANGTNGRGSQKLATGKWLTGSSVGGSALTGLVGNVYIYYTVV